MARKIVAPFFDQQKAGEVNSIINNNFLRVAKYIPVHFDTLGTVDRLNLTSEWKEHGKLVYDIDEDCVYIWDSSSSTWNAKLLKAMDEYARYWAERLRQYNIGLVTLTGDGLLSFYNIDNMDSEAETLFTIQLQASQIRYTTAQTVYAKIVEMTNDIDTNRTNITAINSKIGTGTLNTTAQTLIGGINEVKVTADDAQTKANNIINGTTKVPSALHADEADLAANSTKLGGVAASGYTLKTAHDTLASTVASQGTQLGNHESRITTNATNITTLQGRLTTLQGTVATISSNVSGNTDEIAKINNTLDGMKGVLIPKGTVPNLGTDPQATLTQYIYDNYYTGGYIYKGATALTAGSEQTQLNNYIQTTYGTAPQLNWAVIDNNGLEDDAALLNTWVYNGTEWENEGALIRAGWTIRNLDTNDMWVYDTDRGQWVNFGGALDIGIATSNSPGLVKSGGDISVDSNGTVTVSALSNYAQKSATLSQADITSGSQAYNFKIRNFKNDGTSQVYDVEKGITGHTIYWNDGTNEYALPEYGILKFSGNVTVTSDATNHEVIVNIAQSNYKLNRRSLHETISTSSTTWSTSFVVNNYDSNKDLVDVYINGAKVTSTKYAVSYNSSTSMLTIQKTSDGVEWLAGWEVTVEVIQVVAT